MLSIVFLLSNICSFATSFGTIIYDSKPKYVWLYSIGFGLALGLRQAGHWWFTFEYVDCAINLQYAFKKEQVPEERRRSLYIKYFLVTIIQFLLPFVCFCCLAGVYTYNPDHYQREGRLEMTALVLFFLGTIGQYCQTVTLLYGIIKIRQQIKNNGYERMINKKAFALHMLLFSTFCIVLLIDVSITATAIFKNKKNGQGALQFTLGTFNVGQGIQILVSFVLFLLQLLLAWILWRSNDK